MSHTEGRLETSDRYIVRGLQVVATCISAYGFVDSEANARRLVACWNYCIGMSTEHLEAGDDWKAEALALVAHGHVISAVKHCRAKTGWGLKKAVDEVKALQAIKPVTNECDALVKERDELVGILRRTVKYANRKPFNLTKEIDAVLTKYPEAS